MRAAGAAEAQSRLDRDRGGGHGGQAPSRSITPAARCLHHPARSGPEGQEPTSIGTNEEGKGVSRTFMQNEAFLTRSSSQIL